jgi:FkbM family methyltransferase
MRRSSRVVRALRGLRRTLAATVAWTLAMVPALEPHLIRLGRAGLRRSSLAAGLYWFVQESLMARLRRTGERYRTVQIRGKRLQLDITDPTGRYPYFYDQAYEPGVTDAIATALGPGDVFVDVGANMGYFTVLAAAMVGDRGRVIAFEPHEGVRDALDETVHRNSAAPTVEIVPLALADVEGEAAFFVEESKTANSTIEPTLSPMRHAVSFRPLAKVQTTTLDGWLAGRPDVARRVRCIKIDVEGAEARVLAGMRQTLRAPTLTILCETTLGSPADKALAAAGFTWRRIEPGAATYGNFLYLRP